MKINSAHILAKKIMEIINENEVDYTTAFRALATVIVTLSTIHDCETEAKKGETLEDFISGLVTIKDTFNNLL